MGKREAGREATKDRIVEAAIGVLIAAPCAPATVEQVAKRAGCAKGLVHYHFKTKEALLAAAAARLWSERCRAWRGAMAIPEPTDALRSAWSVLAAEARDGRLLVCTYLGLSSVGVTGRTVKEGRLAFARGLSDGVVELFEHMGRTPTVPPSEIGALLGSLIDGLGIQMAGGDDPDALEPAWSALWAALISLTRRR